MADDEPSSPTATSARFADEDEPMNMSTASATYAQTPASAPRAVASGAALFAAPSPMTSSTPSTSRGYITTTTSNLFDRGPKAGSFSIKFNE
jgi:hypothetical protein